MSVHGQIMETRTATEEPNDLFEQWVNNSILYRSQRRITSQSIDWSFIDIDITMSSDDSSGSDQIKSLPNSMTTSTPQTKPINALKPTNGKTNQRKRSYIPQHLERTVLEGSPYASPYSPRTVAKKKRKSTDDRTYATLFENNSIHRSFRSMTTQTNVSLRDLRMGTESQTDSELKNKEEVEPQLPELPNKGLEIENEEEVEVFHNEKEVQSEHKSEETQSLRRSKRTRMQVMELWRGQRPIYKMDGSGITQEVVGIYDGFQEEVKPKKRTNKRKFENKCQKNINVFDLSIHNKEIKISDNKDSLNIKSLETLNWNPSTKSEGVDIAIITKNKQKGEAVGVIRIQGLGVKTKSKTGDYFCHLMVVLGVLAIKFKDNTVVKIKTGDNFTIDCNTSYSLSNLRKDVSYINFTVFKE